VDQVGVNLNYMSPNHSKMIRHPTICLMRAKYQPKHVSAFKCKIFGISLSFGVCTEFIYVIFPEFFFPE